MSKNKIQVYEPVSVEDAINCLQVFFESDLWGGIKEGRIKNELELWVYLGLHFDILREEVERLLENER